MFRGVGREGFKEGYAIGLELACAGDGEGFRRTLARHAGNRGCVVVQMRLSARVSGWDSELVGIATDLCGVVELEGALVCAVEVPSVS